MFDTKPIDDLDCFGHFDGTCACTHDDLCEIHTALAHGAFYAGDTHRFITFDIYPDRQAALS